MSVTSLVSGSDLLELADKAKDIVRSFFPDAKWGITIDAESSLDFYHIKKAVSGNSKEESAEFLLSAMTELRFLKPPKYVYWRSCDIHSANDFQGGDTEFISSARFSLGY